MFSSTGALRTEENCSERGVWFGEPAQGGVLRKIASDDDRPRLESAMPGFKNFPAPSVCVTVLNAVKTGICALACPGGTPQDAGDMRCVAAPLADKAHRKALAVRTAKMLAMAMLFTILFGITGSRQTQAQETVYYLNSGKQAFTIPAWAWKTITNNCGEPELNVPISSQTVWLGCFKESLLMLGLENKGNPASGQLRRLMTRDATQTDGTSGLSLSSGTPYLPFLGNQLVELGWIPNSTSIADVTAAYTTDLRRQSDCSLAEDFVLPTATTPSTAAIGSFTGAQDYLHQLAGLTTKADVFANGCDFQVLGRPGTSGILLLGLTPGGASIAAQLADSGLYSILTDPTADTVKITQLTSSQNTDAGYFSAASLRNNGITDLVETSMTDPANQQKATAVLLGKGDGTFQSPVYYDVSDNGLGLFTIDDVNGDGVPDIVVLTATVTTTGWTVNGVTTLLGKGDGTFTVGPASAVTGVPSDQPVTGDFNGDGKKDLLVGGTVLFGDGHGAFTVGPTNAALASIANYLFPGAVGDLRNSGKLDVAATDEGGSVSIFYGNGDGTFAAGPTYAALPDYMQVTITDIDGDGNPDVVLGTSTGGIYTIGGYDMPLPMYQVLMGRGDGTFVDSQEYPEGGHGQNGVASGDFNGDGKPDLLVFQAGNGTTANSLLMLPGDGKGNLGAQVASPLTVLPTQIVSADMNGDGKPDAVLVGSSQLGGSQLAVLFNQGNGTFAGEQDYSLAASAVSVTTGDFNGDSLPDVAVGESGTGVFVLFGQSNGTLGSPVQVDTSTNPTGLAAGSLTTDGSADLVIADQTTGALHVYLGNADGTFAAKTAPTTGATNLNLAALGDLNNDGKLDLIAYEFVPGSIPNPNVANVYTLLGNGDGTFQAANTLAFPDNDTAAVSLAVADFNDDKNVDVAVGNPEDYTHVLLSNGDGTLTDTVMALGQHPRGIAAADVLNNGYPELLVGQLNPYGQGRLAVFQNSTTWTATTRTPAATTTTLSASAMTIAAGSSITFTATVAPSSGSGIPTGTVTFVDGTTTLGNGTLSSSGVATYSTSSLAVGSHSITAIYGGDPNFSTSTSSAVILTVNATGPTLAPTSTTLQASATTAVSGTSITFTAKVAETSGAGIPTGTVTFDDGSTTLGTGTLSSGTATYTASGLSVGSHSITASYGGDSGNAASASTAVSVAITAATAGDFSISLSPTSGSVAQGASATTTVSIAPTGGFSQQVSFACSGLPQHAACSFSPATVTPSGTNAATTTLTIQTNGSTAALQRLATPGRWSHSGATTALSFLCGAGLVGLSLLRWRRKNGFAYGYFGFALAMILAAGAMVGCGGSGSTSKTQAGTSQITITATAGSVTHSATYSLTVQ
jgi:hypothetical protein